MGSAIVNCLHFRRICDLEEKIFESKMFLVPFLLCLPLFHPFESKQFLVELESGKSKIVKTNNGYGTGAEQELLYQKNEAVKNISKLKPDHKKATNNAESTTGSHLTTTDKISEGQDYVFFEFICFMIQWCPFGNPYLTPTEPTRPTFVPGNYEWVPYNEQRH